MSNIVQANNQIQSFGYNQEQVDLIKNTVAKNVTNDELQLFLYLSAQYNLDPFKREIWCVKYDTKSAANIMTSRDGYLKYAQMNEEFKGLISFVVREGDIFEIDAAEYKITHKFGSKRGPILGAWAKCDREGKSPFIAYVEFSEYNKNNQIWKGYPSAMIQKVAEVFVLKRAFGINGLVTKEEIDNEDPVIVDDGSPNNNQSPKNDFISSAQQKRMFAIAEGNQDIVRIALDDYGFEKTSEIPKGEVYDNICSHIEQMIKAEYEKSYGEDFDGEEVLDAEYEEVTLPWDDKQLNEEDLH